MPDRISGLGAGGLGAHQNKSLLTILNDRKSRLELQLANVNEAIAALEANPTAEDVYNKLMKVNARV